MTMATTTTLPLLLLLLLTATAAAVNITNLLSPYPDLAHFTTLLSSTSLPSDLSTLLNSTSLTLLTVPNSHLTATTTSTSNNLPDILRFHVILDLLTPQTLPLIPPTGKLLPTLFQNPNSRSVNVTFDPRTNATTFRAPNSNATLLTLVKTLTLTPPYELSILTVDSLLIPYNLDLMASETRPPLGLNITKTLIDGHDFNVAASMLSASGVVSEFEADEGGAGITLFVPTDAAFANVPSSAKFQSLPADKKAVVLRFHVLHSYYPLGSLEGIVNPVYPTLATEQNGAGSFTVNISRVNGTVGIDTGIVLAIVTQTVFDQNPVAIFGVSRVLLPKEYFGKDAVDLDRPGSGGLVAAAQPPDIALSPENSPQPSRFTGGAETSSRAGVGVLRVHLGVLCIGLWYLLLVQL